MTTEAFFAIGTSLAALVNLETLIDAPQVLDGGRVPALGSVKERDLAGILTRSGKINSRWVFDIPSDAGRIAFNTAAFGSQTVASAELYISTLGEDGHYNPYLAVLDRALEIEDYQLTVGGVYVRAMSVNLFNCRLQYDSKNATATLTASQRLVYCDTSSAGFTATLCAANAVQANTVVSIVKTSAANTLTIARAGSDTIQNATTSLTRTALNARVDLISDGLSNWTVV